MAAAEPSRKPDVEVEDAMGDRVKSCEASSETRLDPTLPIVVRLDGCSFHTYTRGFRRPCDSLIYVPMSLTAQDLVEKFNARLGYTESDEITLVFLPNPPDKNGNVTAMYSGRVQKLCSILASYAGVRFNYHSVIAANSAEAKEAVEKGELQPRLLDRMKAGVAMFDARAFNTPDLTGAMEAVYWRHHYDCHRNSVFAIGQFHFSSKQLYKKGTGAILNMLRGIDVRYNDLPAEFRFGVFIKKKATFHTREESEHGVTEAKENESKTEEKEDKEDKEEKEVQNSKRTKKKKPTVMPRDYNRTALHVWSEPWEGTEAERVELLTNKYYNQKEYEEWKKKLQVNV